MEHIFNRLSVGLGWNRAHYDYDNNIGPDGEIIDNSDRDRTSDAFNMRLGYQFRSDMQAFVSASWYTDNYDEQYDSNGYDRSSDGYALSAGLSLGITGVLFGDVYVSYRDMSYADPRLPDVTGGSLGAGLTWLPTMLTTVRANISSNIDPTTLQSSSGYLGTLYALRVDHELLRDLQINAQLSYRDNEYTLIAGAPENARSYDRVWRFAVGANYYVNRSVFISASWAWSQLNTNVPRDGYDVNQVWLVLGLEK